MPDPILGIDTSLIVTAAQLTANDPNRQIPNLGQIAMDGRLNKRYRFMRATTAWVANDIIVRDYAGTQEPNDGAPCTAVAQPVAGVALTTVPVNGAGWVQFEGEHPNVNVAASTAGQMVGTTATSGRGTGITMTTPTTAESLALMAATQSCRITALDVAAGNLCQCYLGS